MIKISNVAIVALLTLAPSLALAEANIVCESKSGKTLVVVTDIKTTVSERTGGDSVVEAKVILAKTKGTLDGSEVNMSGTSSLSAKGLYYELTGGDGYSLFVAAVASASDSELKIGNRTIKLQCN